MTSTSDFLLAQDIINKQIFQLMDVCTNELSPPNVKMPACAAVLGALTAKRGLKLADFKATITEKELVDHLNLMSNNSYNRYTKLNSVEKAKLDLYNTLQTLSGLVNNPETKKEYDEAKADYDAKAKGIKATNEKQAKEEDDKFKADKKKFTGKDHPKNDEEQKAEDEKERDVANIQGNKTREIGNAKRDKELEELKAATHVAQKRAKTGGKSKKNKKPKKKKLKSRVTRKNFRRRF